VTIRWPFKKIKHKQWVGINLSTLAPSAVIYSPQGIVACESFDQEQGIEALAGWLKVNVPHGMPAILVLDDDDYELLLAEAPNVPDEELSAAIGFRIGDLLAQSVEETAIQAVRLPADAYRGRMSMAHVITSANEKIQHWVEWAEKLHLDIQMITVPELSLLNVLAASSVTQGIALLELGPKQGCIRLYQDGALYLTRQVEVGIDALDLQSEIAEEIEDKIVDKIVDKIEEGKALEAQVEENDPIVAVNEINFDDMLKDDCSELEISELNIVDEEMVNEEITGEEIDLQLDDAVGNIEEPTYVGFAPKAKVNEQQVQSLILEVQRSLDYYESQLGMGQITQLWLMAGDLDLSDVIDVMQPVLTASIEQPNIAEKLQQNTGIEIAAGCSDMNCKTLALGGALAYELG